VHATCSMTQPRSTCATTWRTRSEPRPFKERAALREYAKALEVDESALRRIVKPEMAQQDRKMRALIARGVPHNEALLNCSKTFNDLMCEHCMKAVLERDQRAIKLADKNPAAALYAYRQLGMLDPPWATYKRGKERHFVHELATSLDTSRPNREYALRSRIVRVETSEGYSATRLTPQQLTLPAVDHVISAADVARLRGGETLVLDPNPALLPPEGMAAVMADLMRMVQHGRGVVESHNPCNSGSYHGMLPVDPSAGRSQGLDPHTCTLLRKLAALPAIIDRHGWHRPLSVPAMVQLGYYPGGRGARYRPHLDRWANEVSNRRELTFIVYVNCGWDAERHGGHLRLHTDPNDLNGRGEGTIDVEPIAGRVIVFESGKQMHEVCESTLGADRLALTLWVEYEEEWKNPEADMMPAIR